MKDPNDPNKVITTYIFEPSLLDKMKRVFSQSQSQAPSQTVYVNPEFIKNVWLIVFHGVRLCFSFLTFLLGKPIKA